MRKTFKIEFDTVNAIFEENPAEEIRRILDRVGDYVESGYIRSIISDANGNKIGHWAWDIES